MTREEAERQWRIHGNEVLEHDEDYQKAVNVQRRVGNRVGIAYIVLVGSLLAFMCGFYLWRFRFFWAIVTYVVLWTIAALAARVITKHSVKNDHLGELISKARKHYIDSLTMQ